MSELVRELLSSLLVIGLTLAGLFFMVLSTFGVLRMPDTYGRLHAAGKAGTLGIVCLLLAVGVYLGTAGAIIRMVALIALFFATAPVAAHMIGRVVWRSGGSCTTD